MQWTWNDDPFIFRMANGSSFSWLTQEDDWWKHTLRNATRQMRWCEEARRKGSKQSTWRESFDGAEAGVNIHATTALLKAQTSACHDPDDGTEMAPEEDDEFAPFLKLKIKGAARAILRQLLTDSIFTWRRRWRMEQVAHPTCPFCETGDETMMHINWQCPAWEKFRAPYVKKYGVPAIMCEACCGILPESSQLNALPMPPTDEPPETARPLPDTVTPLWRLMVPVPISSRNLDCAVQVVGCFTVIIIHLTAVLLLPLLVKPPLGPKSGQLLDGFTGCGATRNF